MAVLMVPGIDDQPFPTLGFQVVEWMEEYLVHGPGPVLGQPYRLDAEKRGIVYKLYEVYPKGHPKAGRRRFKRAGLSVRKGWAKTELMAAFAGAELHPDAPVRFDGWDADGEPVGVGVSNPYIPLVAFTEEQVEELAFGALVKMLAEGPLADDFDLGSGDARSGTIHVLGPTGKSAGKCVALAAAPSSRDGARTTFQGFDETHRQDSDRLRHAHNTMLENLPKLAAFDPWALEVTTSYEPGKDSIAERTHAYAKKVDQGKVSSSTFFFYHRYASDAHDLKTRQGRMDALVEASGPAAAHLDLDYALERSYETDDFPYWERVNLNREVTSHAQFFSVSRWDELALPREDDEPLWLPGPRALVTLGFDGSKSLDSTALVVTDLELRRQAVAGLWEHPLDAEGKPEEGWEVPVDEVNTAIAEAFKRWDVALLYADPFFWETQVSQWHAEYGTRRFGKRRLHRVAEWHTNRPRPMALSLKAYRGAIKSGELSHSGDPRFRSHIANARRYDTQLYDEDRKPLETIRKERSDSPDKIDLAMAGCLSWEAWRDATSLGAKKASRTLHAY